MKLNIKRIIIIALMISLMITVVSVTYAGTDGSFVVSNFKGNSVTSTTGGNAIKNIVSAVLGIVRTAGAAVAVVILMTIGAKYMIASAGDRADIKKYAVNYIIGAIILFGTSGILSIVQNFVNSSVKYGS